MVDNEGSGAKSQITALTNVNNIQRKKDKVSKLMENFE
jgi:hypothetical protein